MPDLVSYISNWAWKKDGDDDDDDDTSRSGNLVDKEEDGGGVGNACNLRNLRLNHALTETMRYSLHPPHVLERDSSSSSSFVPVPGASFPICSYDGDGGGADAAVADEYPSDRFCGLFRTTFNDHGLCYTFNNVRLGSLGGSDDGLEGGNRKNYPIRWDDEARLEQLHFTFFCLV